MFKLWVSDSDRVPVHSRILFHFDVSAYRPCHMSSTEAVQETGGSPEEQQLWGGLRGVSGDAAQRGRAATLCVSDAMHRDA